MKNKILVGLLFIGLILSVFYNFYADSKVKSIRNYFNEVLQENKEFADINNGLLRQSMPVVLNYNARTGELFANIPSDVEHTCVWTIWGDHGSQFTLTTDYALLSINNNPQMESFLPPRVPIYMTCIDWGNKSYYGKIGEYEKNN